MRGLHIQARLHPGDEHEAQAIKEYLARRDAGQEPRQILTDALCALAGEPIYEPETFVTVRHLMETLQEALIENITTMLETKMGELAQMSPADRRRHVSDTVKRGSSFAGSIRQSIDVSHFDEDGEG